MPHSVFFHNGYAIHGTTEVSRLRKIASHGCVRLHTDNAAKLYALVQSQMANTRVVVSDDVIEPPSDAPKKKPSQFVAANAAGKEPAINAKPALAAMVMTEKAAEPRVTKTAATPAETTAVLRERKSPARAT